ncbi:MAG TPA: alpha/beta hydrolase-fold protein [Pyrinomonadaceae bacterium]|jgi:poly(3-hydroxybutyrate) depolymerase|nr:alpha/beta hydrolase-fold protein [Pyrinomonadaceae bacterium]
MNLRSIFAGVVLCCGLVISGHAQKVNKNTVESHGQKRTYYLMVPEGLTAANPAPLLLLLHGSGRNGQSLMDKWKDIGVKQGIVLVAPDAIKPEGWFTPEDGPDLLHDVITQVTANYPIDQRRMYVFGHSGGATFALYMGLFESQYFAAVAIHAGALRANDKAAVAAATRKIPFQIAVGTVDPNFPLTAVRATRDLLVSNGFTVDLIEMKGHDHWYYDLAPKINETAWTFLKDKKLTEDPHFTQYVYK